MTARQPLPLDVIQVATPCKADWKGMPGDDKVRHCGQCQKNVYNLSGLTREEAEGLIVANDGQLCVRFFRRADGTILTADCPVAWWDVRFRIARLAACIAAIVAFLTLGMVGAFGRMMTGEESPRLEGPFERLASDLEPPHTMVMGAICIPPPPPPLNPTGP